MTTRRAGRRRWQPSPSEPRPPERQRGPAASPPVLSLSHFRRSPFLCFGDVRPGASRTLPLAVDNPNDEEVEVTVSRLPAADLGFSVSPRRFVLQPKEKIVISVNWTPFKEGRVREIVTFLVNDVVKHQAILLGNAEEQKRKKRSLWETIKNKKTSASSTHNRGVSNIHVNKTFSVSPKVDKVRSPLQACENLAINEGYSPTENNSLMLEEDKLPISPISPTFKECHGDTCLPLVIRRSTTYSSLHIPENGESLKVEGASISKDFYFNEKVITKSPSNSININGQSEDNSKLTLTPNYSSTLNITQSQGNFLSPDSFVNNSHTTNTELEIVTSDTFMKDNLKPVYLESKMVHEIYRTILSPDSFINDNYALNQNLESESIKPILPPNQFVKDNMAYVCTYQQTCKLSPSSNENSGVLQSQDSRKSEVLPCIPECQDSKSPKAIFEELVEKKSNYYNSTKQNHPKFSAVQDISSYSHDKQPKRRPILSATVTKRKPTHARENQTETNKPKAKRCLDSAVGECEKVINNQEEKEAFHSCLPIITPSLTTVSVARKRKSDGSMAKINVRIPVTEHMEGREIKRIHFSPSESKTSTARKPTKVKTPISKCMSNREKLNLKKKTDLIFKTPISKTNKRTKPLVAVAQSNLTFIKPLKTAIPRHPMPFAAKNMFYDERWKEKQEQGFTWWLNFILTPDDFTVKTNISEVNAATLLLGVENQHKISVPKAPTKEEMSLRAYTARCRLNRLRRTACNLFTSEKMVKAIKKLEIEIEARRLIVRKDRHLWKDVGERQKVLNWLLSYNPLWLRIGLETIYGELIPLEDNSDVTGLAMFILNRLLWNPDIAAEYRHPTVPHLYRDGHEEALSKFTLKKLLLLVCFLDYAKISRLIDHDPCLFCKDAEFKASKEILLAFSRDFLSGEGDLSRHLSLLGLPVNHVQTPFDEFDFAVTNLAVDLQCGVRLVRTMELLTQNWTLSKKLRIPAISRLQKMHNVDIVLQILKSRGIQLNDEHGNTILSKDIVDRHREKTLGLLWKIAFAFQVDISLNLDQLKKEIDFLKHTQSIKKTMSALSCHSDVINKKKDKRTSGSFEQYSENIKLLMDWVNAVCAFYNKKVENFTVSFSDGRVLCYLIHHYHPCYVPFDAICQRTTQTVECTQTGSVVLNSSSESDDSSLDMSLKASGHENTSELYKELLENEKKNFHLVSFAVRDLGGIPAMINHSDMSNTIPDEKVVITYLSFLCARLLDLRKEIRAARLIQTTWRKYKLKKDLKRHQEQDKAARIIQSAIVNFLTKQRLKKEVNAALVIQKYWRRLLAQRKLLMLKREKLEKIQYKSASIIQSYWRRYSSRKRFLKLKYYSIILQSRIRMIIAVTSYKRNLWAIVTIQRHWRACLRRKQARYRGYKVRQLIKQQSIAALKIQTACRGYSQRVKYQSVLQSIVKIQRWYRAYKTVYDIRTHFLQTRAAVISLQSAYRGWKARRQIQREHQAAVKIQSAFRMAKARKQFRFLRTATVVIQQHLKAWIAGKKQRLEYIELRLAALTLQSTWKGRTVRRQIQRQHQCAIIIQACYRMHVQQKKWKAMKEAALLIQKYYRAYSIGREQRCLYLRKKEAIVILQSAYRGMKVRKRIKDCNKAAVTIQSSYRAYKTKRKYATYRASAIIIQRWYRDIKITNHQHEEYLNLRKAAVKVQAVYRGVRVRRHIQHMHIAATSIKAMFKMHQSRVRYHTMRSAAIIIQVRYRAYYQGKIQREKYLTILKAINILQASFRGVRVRQTLKRMHTAATLIQSYYRRYRQQTYFNKLKKVTKTIQQRYRAVKKRHVQFQRYNKLRHSIICIQAVFRGMKARRHLKVMHVAATLIQRRFRTLMMRRRFLTLKKTVIWIQRKYRAHLCAKRHLQFLRLQKAAIRIQTSYRRWMVRKKMQEMHRAATLIQATFRMHIARMRYQALKQASIVIQWQYQANRAAKLQRQHYLRQRHSAVILQAAFRGMKIRRHLKTMHSSATLIQRRFRSLVIRRRFISLKKAAIFVQRKFRATICAKHTLHQFLQLRKAAIIIQSSYRRLIVKKKLQEMHKAAVLIQATFRMHKTYITFQTWKHASILIQRHYRIYRAAKLQRENYVRQWHSAVVIQAAYKGMKARQLLREKHQAAIIIQSTYRMYRQYYFYQRLQWATKVIQEKYRANKKKSVQHNELKKAETCIQTSFQDMNIRKQIEKRHQAAVIIQKHFKAFKIRRHYLHLKATVVSVQRRYRALTAVRTQAVLCIQSSYRGLKVHRDIQSMHLAATLIQSFYRMHRAKADYQAKKTAVVVIQNYYRSYVRVKMERKKFLAVQKSARTIQAAFRGMKIRQKLKTISEEKMSAIIGQSALCCYGAKMQYDSVQSEDVMIQEWHKAAPLACFQDAEYHSQSRDAELVKKVFHKMFTRELEIQKCAALRIQSFLQMAVCRRRFVRQKRATITLQQYFRTRQTRRRFLLYRKAAVVLQNHHRALLSAKQQRQVYLQIRNSVIIIQARTKGFIQKRKFQKIKNSTIKIQALWRRYKAKKYLCKVKAACKIQAWYRCCRARKEYLAVLKAVKIIQGRFYTKLERTRFLNLRTSTIIIQRKWRATLSARIAREHFLMIKRHQAACLIQAHFRGYKGRQIFLQQKSAALIIQRYVRAREAGKCERIKYVELKKSTVILQALILEQKAKIRLLHFTAAGYYHLSALRIQRAYRRHMAMKNASKQVHAAICIQRWFRARLQQKRLIQKYHGIIKTEYEVQEHLSQQNRAASVIQKAVRQFLLHKKQERFTSAITKIQALWRGYSWRKKNDCTKIKAIRLSLQVVNREVREENKLYKRTALALHYLLTYKHFSAILEALKHLEVVTRLSPLCCENMAQSAAISKIFVLIRSCNRSVPCMEVIRYSVQVLLNVAKYEKTTSAVYEVGNCIDTLLELLQTYREKSGDRVTDKGGSIFTKTCCLLAILLKPTSRASDVRSRSKVVDRIYSLYKLTARKHKMDNERMLYKQKKNSSVSIPFFPETPVRTRIVSRLNPDWVLRRDSLEDITDPLQAIQMVMDTLGIPY
uniref:Abnormal spindle-like microcephaly-associated protein isoform X1 n=1 Tax=Microcebus murinus TaxID=30608 RepID=A0A8B7EYR1_MICMU|nr:abnormal spindle-like microcephaly-associated protein isoform X1 [Microcebus murinus]XP_012599830.1 abnormal spindle-like microcephaly-associated protein isoform X1 [Microcebus murinus]